ncbi:MAG: zinc-ribbon and DUF3426 domain-containing protein [Usitatibacter sp.]
MLITTCVHCRARFRVTPQQLNAKQGQVRCGRCRSVFNGFESLERFPDDDTGARLLAAREAAERASGIPPPVEPLPFDELPDIETLQADVSEPAQSAPSYVEAPAPVPSTPAASPRQKRAPRTPVEEVTLPPPPRARRPARAWGLGAAFLTLALALELAYVFRAGIAQRYPIVRPYLESACAAARCTVPWPREETSLKLEDSELLEVPGKPNEIALGARIRNLATVAQEYPNLELTLTDITGQPAIRRVLRPADYLGRPVRTGDTLAAGSELSVQLRLETPRIKATGYELLLFYP